ncbi:MAG: hypothetical protein HYR70_04350 [Chloroflexi bacterium]|nr:hypothetical protein [Chloroflexota bacterium]MBI3340788.1 hypothetical protein [Chloroflexota bacterium]
MKRFSMLAILVLATLLLSACAPQGAPTPSLAELQATALADAQAKVALTAASIPTATQIPPTPIPPTVAPPLAIEPTLTPVVLQPVAPTQQVIVVSSATKPADGGGNTSVSSSGNPCSGPISKVKGPKVDITFAAKIKGTVSLYFYGYKTAFGCGYGSVTLATGESTTVAVPAGCYDFYGWVNGPKASTPKGYGCFQQNAPKMVTIRPDDIVITSP